MGPDERGSEQLWQRAQQHIECGHILAAQHDLESLLARDPGHVSARMLLVSSLLNQGEVRSAAKHAVTASKATLQHVHGIAAVSQCLMRLGEVNAARTCLARFDALKSPCSGPDLRSMASCYQLLGDNRTALQFMNNAAATGYDNADFHYFHGLQLQFDGQLEAARQKMRLCLERNRGHGRAALALARLSKGRPDAGRLDVIECSLDGVPPASEQHAAFQFARFEELDSLSRHAEAFVALRRANAVMAFLLAGEYRIDKDIFDQLKRRANDTFLHGPGACIDGPIPIFIVGMPRSGTTLLDRLLDNHPDVTSVGERNDFPLQLRWTTDRNGSQIVDPELLAGLDGIDYELLGRRYLEQTQWRAAGKRFYVDKLPPNHLLVGLIHRALPQAPILHMERGTMDVCFSNYRVLFGNSYPFSYDLGELIGYCHLYEDLMRYWHSRLGSALMRVSYEDLVSAPEAGIQRVFAHCGLRAVSGCSDLSQNTTAVATLSSTQVRQPIHQRSVNQWQRYGACLAPLAELVNNDD